MQTVEAIDILLIFMTKLYFDLMEKVFIIIHFNFKYFPKYEPERGNISQEQMLPNAFYKSVLEFDMIIKKPTLRNIVQTKGCFLGIGAQQKT